MRPLVQCDEQHLTMGPADVLAELRVLGIFTLARQPYGALAEALIRVARMGAAPFQLLATQLLGNPADLAARVERLIEPGAENAPEPRVWPGVALAACGAAAAFQPSTLAFVHEALEALAH